MALEKEVIDETPPPAHSKEILFGLLVPKMSPFRAGIVMDGMMDID